MCRTRIAVAASSRYIPAARSTPTYRIRATPTITAATITATRHQSSISYFGSASVDADDSRRSSDAIGFHISAGGLRGAIHPIGANCCRVWPPSAYL